MSFIAFLILSCQFTSASVFQMKLGQPVFLGFLPLLFQKRNWGQVVQVIYGLDILPVSNQLSKQCHEFAFY